MARDKTRTARFMRETPDIFSDSPRRTTLVEHTIHAECAPIKQKPYRIPYSLRKKLKKELDDMLEARIIRPSLSPWASPVILIPKKMEVFEWKWTIVNSMPKQTFDAYPMPWLKEMFWEHRECWDDIHTGSSQKILANSSKTDITGEVGIYNTIWTIWIWK